MWAGRRCFGLVAALGLSVLAACAHGRNQPSRGLSPTAPPRQSDAASSDASSRPQDKTSSARKQLERTTSGPNESSHDPSERPVGQIGSGPERSASTTGVVSQPASSGGWSSVVSETPRSTPGPPTSTAGQARGPAESERRSDATALRATIVACVLVAAIIWLPRRLHQ